MGWVLNLLYRMNGIVLPPRVYLDLNHVINVCRLRRGKLSAQATPRQAYEAISEAARTGLITVLFNPGVFVELADRQEGARERTEEVAAFFESCISVLEVEPLHGYLFELVEEARRHVPDLSLPTVPVVRAVGDVWGDYRDLLRHHPEYPDDFGPRTSVTIRTWMESALRMAKNQPDLLQLRAKGWRYSVRMSRAVFERFDKEEIPHEAMVHWANHANEFARVLISAMPELDVDAVGRQIDFTRCRASNVFVRGFWHYSRNLAGADASDNDADDWFYVPAVAHADYALIERRMRSHLVSANPGMSTHVFAKPQELVEALDALTTSF